MRVALIHDWLTGMRGGERCLEQFIRLYPQADVFTLLHVPGKTSKLIDERVRGTSWMQKLPHVQKYYRGLLPLFPFFSKTLKVEHYDLVISLSHAAAKNVPLQKGQTHLCFCFTPMRYISEQAPQYFGKLLFLAQPLLAMLRSWDEKGSKQVTRFVAISTLISERIKTSYGRESTIVFPPVATEWITPRKEGEKGEAFLVAGAMVPYKRLELAVQACSELQEPLWIVGDGPERGRLERMAGKTVKFFGRLSDEGLAEKYRRCRALIFPGVEDFGMMPVECLAAGRPVIGRRAGGLEDILGDQIITSDLPGESKAALVGVGFPDVRHGEVEVLKNAIRKFIELEPLFSAQAAIQRASAFSPKVFQEAWLRFAQGN